MCIQVYYVIEQYCILFAFIDRLYIYIFKNYKARWRGASPIVYQILFSDKLVGVTLMKILPKQLEL